MTLFWKFHQAISEGIVSQGGNGAQEVWGIWECTAEEQADPRLPEETSLQGTRRRKGEGLLGITSSLSCTPSCAYCAPSCAYCAPSCAYCAPVTRSCWCDRAGAHTYLVQTPGGAEKVAWLPTAAHAWTCHSCDEPVLLWQTPS